MQTSPHQLFNSPHRLKYPAGSPSEGLSILFRVDANPAIGISDLNRCIRLAKAWKSLGGRSAFACQRLPSLLEAKMNAEGFETYSIQGRDHRADVRNVKEIQLATDAGWLVVCGQQFDSSYMHQLGKETGRVVALDASNPVVFATQNTNLTGREYYVPCIAAPRGTQRPIAARARRLVVALTEEVPNRELLLVLEAICQIKQKSLVVDVVSRRSLELRTKLEKRRKECSPTLRFHSNPDRLTDLISRADFAVCDQANTLLEMAHRGVPTLALRRSKGTNPAVDDLIELGAIIGVEVPDFATKLFAKQLAAFAADRELRTRLSQRSVQLVDDQGAHRIARRLASELFELRDIRLSDSELLLSWRNEPEFRALTFQPQTISKLEHERWIAEKIEAKNSAMWMAMNSMSQPIGTISIEIEDERANMEICVAPSHRGRGRGTMLIEMACRKLLSQFHIRKVLAQIKPQNTASLFAFKKAGFRPIAPTTKNGATAMQMLFESKLEGHASTEQPLRKSA